MSNENKIAIILGAMILISVPTWFSYQNDDFAWLVTDASRLIRISIAVLGFYFLTNIYHLKVAILGYFMATLSNVVTVFLSDDFLNIYSKPLLYIRLIFLGLSGIFFLIFLKDALKIFYSKSK